MNRDLTIPGASRRLRSVILALLGLLVPTITNSQARKNCPQFARVPGYGACANIAGKSCGFCTYRCNDETVVRWNVCGT